ncbi:MAG: AbrB/MazE/SpoVT family DNA-binding domain-containing protein [Clostridiales bacterium]|nr:AbrB/MazE/SpoVT family DNA-binding domain-containing protein [Clostridiales bacterium]
MLKCLKRLDDVGRLVLPKELRKALELTPKDWITIKLSGEEMVIKKLVDSCAFCESKQKLIKIKEKFVCEHCRKDLCRIYDELKQKI